jgi:hypothetical protein
VSEKFAMSFGQPPWPEIRFNVIGDAWRLYKRHWVVWSVTVLIVLAGNMIGTGIIASVLGHHGHGHHGGYRWPVTPIHGFAQYITWFIITGFFLAGMLRMAGNEVRGRAPRIEDLFTIKDIWIDVVLVSALYGAAIFVGSWFCFIPAFIAAGVFMFALPLVVEARLPATGAMIQSWHTLKSQWFTATIFHFVLSLVSWSGAILCGIGLIFTAPLYCLSLAVLYRDFFADHASPAWKPSKDPFPDI